MGTIQAEAILPRRMAVQPEPNPALFAEHRDAAYRVAWRLLGDPQAALRIVAASFIRAFRKSPIGEHSEAFKARLLRIQLALVHGQPGIKPVEKGARTTKARRMRHALRALPREQREAFTLAIDGQLSYRQIADVQGVSVETAMQRIYKARRKLRALLWGRSNPIRPGGEES